MLLHFKSKLAHLILFRALIMYKSHHDHVYVQLVQVKTCRNFFLTKTLIASSMKPWAWRLHNVCNVQCESLCMRNFRERGKVEFYILCMRFYFNSTLVSELYWKTWNWIKKIIAKLHNLDKDVLLLLIYCRWGSDDSDFRWINQHKKTSNLRLHSFLL